MNDTTQNYPVDIQIWRQLLLDFGIPDNIMKALEAKDLIGLSVKRPFKVAKEDSDQLVQLLTENSIGYDASRQPIFATSVSLYAQDNLIHLKGDIDPFDHI